MNHSVVSEFVFPGLANSWEIQLLFVFSSVFYVASMLGNSLILLTVMMNPHLHSPMYFLLANLSLIDLGVSSVISPKMIYDLFRNRKVISFGGCVTQIVFLHIIGGVEMVLLVTMAFDRYIAICKPVHSFTIMNRKKCILLVVAAWIIGLIHSIVQLVFVAKLPFCGPNRQLLLCFTGVHGHSQQWIHIPGIILHIDHLLHFYPHHCSETLFR